MRSWKRDYPVIDPEKDGIDHINIYSKGKTRLGRKLTNFAFSPFEHPEDGKFNSIEGYWYWVSTEDDRLRKLSGFRAKKLGRELGAPDYIEEDEFERKIKMAIKAKLDCCPALLEELKNTKIPLLHYYNYGGKVVEPKKGKWVIEYLETFKETHD